MKKIIYLILALPFLLLSCNKEGRIETPKTPKIPVIPESGGFNVVKIPSKSLLYDEIYEIRNGKEIDLTNTQNQTKATLNRFYEITTIHPNKIYAGSVLSAQSINSEVYKSVGFPNVWKKLVTISFSLPVWSKEAAPKLASFRNAVKEAIGDRNFSEKQSQVFTYKMKEFSYYSELKLAFGANVNIAKLFKIKAGYEGAKTNATSALFIDFSQTYFTVDMDMPDDGNIFIDEATRKKYSGEKPVYINTVNLGRKGVIMVESNKSYKEISLAVRSAFTAKIVDGKLNLNVAHKKMLEEADIQIYIIGGWNENENKRIQGFQEFENFIISGGVNTQESYGAPISFSAAYAEDNSMFVTEFQVKHN